MRSGFGLAQDIQVEDVIGFERRVRFELAQPISLLRLQGKQMLRAAFDGLREAIFQGHGGRDARRLRTEILRMSLPDS